MWKENGLFLDLVLEYRQARTSYTPLLQERGRGDVLMCDAILILGRQTDTRIEKPSSLNHSLNPIFHGVACIAHIHNIKNECDNENDDEFYNALENGKEEHNNQDYTNGKIQGAGEYFVDKILHKRFSC